MHILNSAFDTCSSQEFGLQQYIREAQRDKRAGYKSYLRHCAEKHPPCIAWCFTGVTQFTYCKHTCVVTILQESQSMIGYSSDAHQQIFRLFVYWLGSTEAQSFQCYNSVIQLFFFSKFTGSGEKWQHIFKYSKMFRFLCPKEDIGGTMTMMMFSV